MLVTDMPEALPSTNDLDTIEDPDAPTTGERAEIYLSGAHVATLDDAPNGLGRVTLMVELEVTEESIRFTEDGQNEIPIRRCRRVGDMWRPGTERPPTKEEIKQMQAATKAKAAAEAAERDEAERAEAATNEPPMFDEEGDPVDPEAPKPPADNDDQGRSQDDGTVVAFTGGPAFSDTAKDGGE
ncbi:Uncharacterised protein [Mycobacteroides abscessus subsp. massiliense]|uniref:hypothetical protein n=1 Tax=Mycobacteroides abscessus TaxID=36809 RepID=UPI0009A84EDF|nr:hypothetical protein [Mycobacteroides abscessus]SKH53624.1 Uncharacterised protein [Mycobacteroides abscessus subsp. massiliense]SKH84213.1 Uncharacterised protein [Mycobacteroides abscessus subsp. massiliense]SKK33559.1 Uncharacterised protein [Mycobacteroides abscessus subsp. massiliense]SKK45809.1 Uncharacterised protein [Mycobacteroides abscessus subsp. massiliense]SKL87410.1 Uncharacterised protein [Mycobacteroides abscessus subsp. massiliense]